MPIRPWIYEFLICEHMKWTPDYVRSMDNADFMIYLTILFVRQELEKEFEMAIHGIDVKKKAPDMKDVLSQGVKRK